jgi:hypothetical protein
VKSPSVGYGYMGMGAYYNNGKSAMETLAEKVQSNNPLQKIEVSVDSNPVTMPAHVVGLLLDKITQMKSFIAIPFEKRRKSFQRADRGMEP